jgi:hypothetical protein
MLPELFPLLQTVTAYLLVLPSIVDGRVQMSCTLHFPIIIFRLCSVVSCLFKLDGQTQYLNVKLSFVFSHLYRAASWSYHSVMYTPTDAPVSCLKIILKFTLKQLQHVSVQSHQLQGAHYLCLPELQLLKQSIKIRRCVVNMVVVWLHMLVGL